MSFSPFQFSWFVQENIVNCWKIKIEVLVSRLMFRDFVYKWFTRLKRSLLRSPMCSQWIVQWLFVVIFMVSFMIWWSFSRLGVKCLRQITFSWYICYTVNLDDLIISSSLFELYVFLNAWQGDFVDRGYNSLEVFTILLLLKARYVCSFPCLFAFVVTLDLL